MGRMPRSEHTDARAIASQVGDLQNEDTVLQISDEQFGHIKLHIGMQLDKALPNRRIHDKQACAELKGGDQWRVGSKSNLQTMLYLEEVSMYATKCCRTFQYRGSIPTTLFLNNAVKLDQNDRVMCRRHKRLWHACVSSREEMPPRRRDQT